MKSLKLKNIVMDKLENLILNDIRRIPWTGKTYCLQHHSVNDPGVKCRECVDFEYQIPAIFSGAFMNEIRDSIKFKLEEIEE